MTKNIWLMCGVPGSGKSTYILEHYNPEHDRRISRDEIRFKLLKERKADYYFAYEEEVWALFINNINEAIKDKNIENIYIDATHINERSRNKVLNQLKLSKVKLNAISFEIPLEECIKRNNNRTGLAFVPASVITAMYNDFCPPTQNEKYKYDRIITIVE